MVRGKQDENMFGLYSQIWEHREGVKDRIRAVKSDRNKTNMETIKKTKKLWESRMIETKKL